MYTSLEQFKKEKLKELEAMDMKSPYDSSVHVVPLMLVIPFLSQAIDEAAEATVEAVEPPHGHYDSNLNHVIYDPEYRVRANAWLTPTKETNPPSV